MAQLSNLIVTGVSRLLGKLYVNDTVTAPKFVGTLDGKIVGTLVHDKDYTITKANEQVNTYGFDEAGIYMCVASCTLNSANYSSVGIILSANAGNNGTNVTMIGIAKTIPSLSIGGSMMTLSSPYTSTFNIKVYKLKDGV